MHARRSDKINASDELCSNEFQPLFKVPYPQGKKGPYYLPYSLSISPQAASHEPR